MSAERAQQVARREHGRVRGLGRGARTLSRSLVRLMQAFMDILEVVVVGEWICVVEGGRKLMSASLAQRRDICRARGRCCAETSQRAAPISWQHAPPVFRAAQARARVLWREQQSSHTRFCEACDVSSSGLSPPPLHFLTAPWGSNATIATASFVRRRRAAPSSSKNCERMWQGDLMMTATRHLHHLLSRSTTPLQDVHHYHRHHRPQRD